MQHPALRAFCTHPLYRSWTVRLCFVGTLLLTVGFFALRPVLRDERATRIIVANGAAVGMPTPDVNVWPVDVGQGVKHFGDSQLAAIAPVLDDVDWFGGLQLGGTSVSDDGLRCVTIVRRLKILYVNGSSISVKGLVQLRGMPNLRTIVFSPGQFSAAELQTLRAAMPGVTVTDYQ